jgi:hypothetical protein
MNQNALANSRANRIKKSKSSNRTVPPESISFVRLKITGKRRAAWTEFYDVGMPLLYFNKRSIKVSLSMKQSGTDTNDREPNTAH